jgi:hypothetical protein
MRCRGMSHSVAMRRRLYAQGTGLSIATVADYQEAAIGAHTKSADRQIASSVRIPVDLDARSAGTRAAFR